MLAPDLLQQGMSCVFGGVSVSTLHEFHQKAVVSVLLHYPFKSLKALVNAALLQDQQSRRIDAWLWLGCQSRAAPTQIQAALSRHPHPER